MCIYFLPPSLSRYALKARFMLAGPTCRHAVLIPGNGTKLKLDDSDISIPRCVLLS